MASKINEPQGQSPLRRREQPGDGHETHQPKGNALQLAASTQHKSQNRRHSDIEKKQNGGLDKILRIQSGPSYPEPRSRTISGTLSEPSVLSLSRILKLPLTA